MDEVKCEINTDEAIVRRETLDKLRLHFVFNSLNAIRYLIKKQPDTAYDMVYDLAKYLRGCTEAIISEDMVPVEEELSFAKAYVSLEEIQRSRLSVSWQIENCAGFVKPGSIYQEAERLLKQEVFCCKEPRTFLAMSDTERALIQLCIVETGETVEIPIQK